MLVSNKLDLGLFFLLLLISSMAMVVSAKLAGAGEMAGSEALFKGSPHWMVEMGGLC